MRNARRILAAGIAVMLFVSSVTVFAEDVGDTASENVENVNEVIDEGNIIEGNLEDTSSEVLKGTNEDLLTEEVFSNVIESAELETEAFVNEADKEIGIYVEGGYISKVNGINVDEKVSNGNYTVGTKLEITADASFLHGGTIANPENYEFVRWLMGWGENTSPVIEVVVAPDSAYRFQAQFRKKQSENEVITVGVMAHSLNDNENAPEDYFADAIITEVNGTPISDAEYDDVVECKPGDVLTISCTEIGGALFSYWSVRGADSSCFDDMMSKTTTFTVPKDAVDTEEYWDIQIAASSSVYNIGIADARIYEAIDAQGNILLTDMAGNSFNPDYEAWGYRYEFGHNTKIKLKPKAPAVPEGYQAVFQGWKNVENHQVEWLENDCIEVTIEAGHEYDIAADFAVRRVDDQNTKYCYIKMAGSSSSIVSVNGVAVDNLKEGYFLPGTELGVSFNHIWGTWFQFTKTQEIAMGRFENYASPQTTYIVPDQNYVTLDCWGGGPSSAYPSFLSEGLVQIVDGKILEIDGEQLDTPSTKIYSKEPCVITVTANEKESTEEYDYVFEKWVSDTPMIQFSNPTEKTTQFLSLGDSYPTMIYALYTQVPKETEDKGEVTVDTSKVVKGMTVEGVKDAVLTEEDKKLLEEGKEINISVKSVELSEAELSTDDKQSIQSVLTDGMKTARIFDITIEKQVEGEEVQIITELTKPIRITFDVKEDLVESESNREFSVIRLHDEKSMLLKDLDDLKEKVTIESELFSLYVLTYRDVADDNDNAIDNNGINTDKGDSNEIETENENVKSDEKETTPITGDSTSVKFVMFMLSASLAGIIVVLMRRRKSHR